MADKETKKIRKANAQDDELANMVIGLMESSERYYSSVKAEWADNYGYWQNSSGQGGKAPLTRNHLPIGIGWMIVDGVLSAMTDGKPTPVFGPEEKSDVSKANALARIITGPLWEELSLEELHEYVIKTALAMSGACVTRAMIDQDGLLHDIAFDPYHCYPEPDVNKLERMEWFFTKVPTPVGKIRRAFGSAADHVSAETMDDDRRAYMGRFQVGTFWKSNNKIQMLDPKKMGAAAERFGQSVGRAFLIHGWMADYDEGEIPFDPEETLEEYQRSMEGLTIKVQTHENHPKHVADHVRQVRDLQKKWNIAMISGNNGLPIMPEQVQVIEEEMDRDLRTIYVLLEHIDEHMNYPQADKGLIRPFGREVWMCQGRILSEGPSPFGNPYRAFQLDQDIAGNFWNKALMSYVVPIQQEFNFLVSKIADHAELVANGRMFYNARLKILWDKVKEQTKGKPKAGIMIPTDGPPQGNVYWDYGGEMPGYVFHLLNSLEQWAYKVGGFTEVMQGQVPAYASGRAMASAIQSAGVRIRKAVKHLGWYYQAKFRDYIKYLKYADETTVWRIIGENNQEQMIAYTDIDWDAMHDVRIDVRNVLGTWREQQFEKMTAILERNPGLAEIILPALAKYLDLPIDMQKLNREQVLENALAQTHDEMTMMKAQMK